MNLKQRSAKHCLTNKKAPVGREGGIKMFIVISLVVSTIVSFIVSITITLSFKKTLVSIFKNFITDNILKNEINKLL